MQPRTSSMHPSAAGRSPRLSTSAALIALLALGAFGAPALAERSAVRPSAPAADFDTPRVAIDPTTALSSRVALAAGTDSLLSMHNPTEAPRTVVLAVVDAEADRFRQSQIVLEPGGRQVMSLGEAGPASWLHLVADGAVEAELETVEAELETVDSAARRRLVLERRADTVPIDAVPIDAVPIDAVPTKASSCVGSWNLTCIDPYDCHYSSGFKPGQVVDGDQVYWNLHYPIGSAVTTNGWCFTYWSLEPLTNCPTLAYNCLGETYRVDVVERTVDLDLQLFQASTYSLPSGGILNSSWRIENFGTAYASTAGLDECVYLSTTNRIDGQETLIVRTPKRSTSLAPGAGYDRQVSTSVNAAPGTYWLIVAADCDDVLGESNRDNNFVYVSGFTVY